MTIQNETTNTTDTNANGEMAAVYYITSIIDAAEKTGEWPSAVNAIAERRGIEPGETLFRELFSDFWKSIKSETMFPFVDDDLGGSDEGESRQEFCASTGFRVLLGFDGVNRPERAGF